MVIEGGPWYEVRVRGSRFVTLSGTVCGSGVERPLASGAGFPLEAKPKAFA
jgi:hypothetical protein